MDLPVRLVACQLCWRRDYPIRHAYADFDAPAYHSHAIYIAYSFTNALSHLMGDSFPYFHVTIYINPYANSHTHYYPNPAAACDASCRTGLS